MLIRLGVSRQVNTLAPREKVLCASSLTIPARAEILPASTRRIDSIRFAQANRPPFRGQIVRSLAKTMEMQGFPGMAAGVLSSP
jgi:hypothetical protein